MIYQKHELLALEKELEKYKRTFYSEYWKENITVTDTDKWLEEKGALKNGAVVLKEGKEPLYSVLQDKLSQMYKLIGRREYAQKMELQSHTETLAKGITVDK